MTFLKRRTLPDFPPPYTQLELQRLAEYNDEVGRGIVHTSEYDARMAEVQERFDRWIFDEPGSIRIEDANRDR